MLRLIPGALVLTLCLVILGCSPKPPAAKDKDKKGTDDATKAATIKGDKTVELKQGETKVVTLEYDRGTAVAEKDVTITKSDVAADKKLEVTLDPTTIKKDVKKADVKIKAADDAPEGTTKLTITSTVDGTTRTHDIDVTVKKK
jgi:uncharacterized membrane protein